MSFVKPLAVAAVLSLGLVACGPKEDATADAPAETGTAADTGAMSSAPTTVNPSDTTGMGTMGTAGTPGSASDTSGMGTTGTTGGTAGADAGTAGGTNTPPPTQGPTTK